MRVSYLVGLAVILVFAALFLPSAVLAIGQESYTCTSGERWVCLYPNVTIANKYGKLTTRFTNQMNMFENDANGTILFDFIGWIASNKQNAITFNSQSYGNGTFDIRIKGPPAVGAVADSPFVQLNANSTWGSGVEILYTRVSSSHELTINYIGVGPACVPFCWNAYPWVIYGVSAVIVPSAVATILTIRKRRKAEESYIR